MPDLVTLGLVLLVGWVVFLVLLFGLSYGAAAVWWAWDRISPEQRDRRRREASIAAWYRKQPGPKPWDGE